MVVEAVDALGPGSQWIGGISDAGYAAGCLPNHDCDRTTRCVLQGASGCSGDPLGDPTVALREPAISRLAAS